MSSELENKIASVLDRYADPQSFPAAEKEIKSIIVNQIDDGEKLNTLISCLGAERAETFTSKAGKKHRFKQFHLFVSVAEIFQYQILEFLPRIFLILNKKISEGDLDLADILSATYGGLIGNPFFSEIFNLFLLL